MNDRASAQLAVHKTAAPLRSIILFVLALAVAAIGTLIWKEYDSLQNVRNGVQGELQMQSLSLSSLFETSFESVEQTLVGVSNRVEYNPGRPGIPLDLRKRLLRAPALGEMRFYSADGRLLERTGLAPLASDDLPDWVQQAGRLGRTTGFGKDDDKLAFYRVASTEQGHKLGTVYATLSPDYFQGVSSQSMLYPVTASCLIDTEGAVVMDIGDLGTSCHTPESLHLLRLLDHQRGGYGSRVQEYGNHILAVRQLRSHPLRVVLIASNDLVLNRWKNAGFYSLAATALIMLAAWLFIRHLRQAEQRSLLTRQELLQVQNHLQASHDLLDRLSQHVPGVIFQYRLHPDGRATIPYASEGLHELFGVRPQDVQNDAAPIFLRVHPEDLQGMQDAMQHSGDTRTVWQHEFRVLDDAQHTRWLAGLANPMLLEEGGLLWHGFIKEITDRKLLEQAIYEHDRDMNTILENSSVGIIFVKGRIQIWANARMAELFGYSMLEIVGHSTRMYYPSSEAYEALGHNGYAAIQRGERYIEEQPLLHKQGQLVWVRMSGKAVDSDNLDAGSIWVFEDVTEQKRLETHLKLAASVFTHAKEGILITDAAGLIVDVNETFSKITGYSRAEALGQNPRILNSGRQPADFYAKLWHSLNEKGHWYGEVWNRRKQGDVYAEMLTISSVLDAAGVVQNYVALFSDITPLKEHQQALEHIAHYDALTNLPNRVLLADRLHQALVQSQRRRLSLAVVFLDLDGFKAVNDSHGHAAGDDLLIALAQNLQATLREGDTLARIGGDEFVAVLVDLEHPQDCEPILLRLLQAAATPIRVGALDLRVSASMGVTLSPQDGVEVDLLMRQADQAMYAAKQAGKNRYHLFDVTQDAAIRQLRDSLECMQRGLLQEQFELYYQAKVNMRTGIVVGAEALIRWNHPQRGLLQPGDFLPVIENHPLSIQMGEWVIRTALAQMSRWQAAGLALPVSVNISSLQLQDEHFPERLRELLAACADVQPGQLELEVLETSAFEDLARIHSIISRCQSLGVHFALDDFGTGYSSLAYLKHLPVETLKIDRSFVHDMLEDLNDLAIVNGVIGLARAFGRQVVAEGVETLAHRDLLIAVGCDVAQGYGIAMPMVAARFPDWVDQWQADPLGAYLQAQPPSA